MIRRSPFVAAPFVILAGIWKLEGRTGLVGGRMPFNGPPFLTAGQVLIIRRWIERGAPND